MCGELSYQQLWQPKKKKSNEELQLSALNLQRFADKYTRSLLADVPVW